MPLQFATIVNGSFQENCYLVWDDSTQHGVLVDPGDEPERILAAVRAKGVTVDGIFNTHGHLDHASAVALLVRELKVPFAIHPGDRPLIEGIPQQARFFGFPVTEAPVIDRELQDGDRFAIGGYSATVLHTPGHTPGGCCFHVENLVFVGDTLFCGSVGRTDLPGGSYSELIRSIQTRLLPLDPNTKVLSGHGPATTIGFEQKHNPFLS